VQRSAFLGLLALPLFLASGAPYAAVPAAQPGAVDPELLEFLADWQGADGNWVDPMTFARIDPAKIKTDDSRHSPSSVPAPGAASAAPAAQANAR
jgi:hypothetical protein